MSEYVYKNNGDMTPEWRRVYVIWCDGDEVGALFDKQAAEVLAESLEDAGNCDVYTREYLQPLEHAHWLEGSLHLMRAR